MNRSGHSVEKLTRGTLVPARRYLREADICMRISGIAFVTNVCYKPAVGSYFRLITLTIPKDTQAPNNSFQSF